MKRKLKKVYIKGLNGYVFVESFNGKHNEERERAKIYDEDMGYLDYISLDNTTKKEYLGIIKEFRKAKDIFDFIENYMFCNVYEFSEDLEYLLTCISENWDEENIIEIKNDLKNLSNKKLVEKYMINRIGDYYFYLGDY